MTTPRAVLRRHSWMRWIVPGAVAGAIALVASGVLVAQASTNLPTLTAAQLLADLESAQVPGLSGTVVEKASLGLPELPSSVSSDSTSVLGLLSGSHTVRVWYGGVDRQRIALLDTVGESDVFHDGTQVWQWNSNTRVATHTVLPADQRATPTPSPATALTPQQLAERALAAIDPTTAVTTDSQHVVAGRAVYELVLTPRDAASRIGSVHLSIDGQHKVPVGVRIYARGAGDAPAIDVSFQSISFTVPDPSTFQFTPPKGATVHQQPFTRDATARTGATRPTVTGTGWTSVAELAMSPASTPAKGTPATASILGALPRVSGAWGSGVLFSSALVTALYTDDGRLFVGAVDPAALYAAAAR